VVALKRVADSCSSASSAKIAFVVSNSPVMLKSKQVRRSY
jgi:hypothetical protein